MNDILDQEIDDAEYDGNLFLEVLTSPRKVFRYLHDHAYDDYVWKLLILSGIIGYIDVSFFQSDLSIIFNNIFMAIFAGGFVSLILNYITASLLSWIGKLFKGTQNSEAILRVIAYSMIPSFFGLIITILSYGYFSMNSTSSGLSGFGSIGSMYQSNTEIAISYIFTFGNIFITTIWPFALITIGISEIQKFPIWKAFLNVLLSIVLFILFGGIFYVFLDMFGVYSIF